MARILRKKRDVRTQERAELFWLARRLIAGCIFTIPAVLIALLFMSASPLFIGITFPQSTNTVFLLATIVQFYVGWPLYVGAMRSLRSKKANVDLPVAVVSSIALGYSTYLVFVEKTQEPYLMLAPLLVTLTLLTHVLEAQQQATL